MVNFDMIELLIAFSVAVWALMSKTPVKSLVKILSHRLFPTYLKYGDWLRVSKDTYVFEQYVIKSFAALIAFFLIGIAQVIDIAIVTDNLSTEWQWLNDAELISAIGVISLIPVKYSLLYYLDLLMTVALISVVGSAGIHRLEKWITGNALLFDILRHWFVSQGQGKVIDIGTARGQIDVSVVDVDEAVSDLGKRLEAVELQYAQADVEADVPSVASMIGEIEGRGRV